MSIIPTNGVEIAYRTHCRTFGNGHKDRVVDQAIEEMAELTAKLMQKRRGRKDIPNVDVIGEITDTLLCLDFLLRDYGVGTRDAQVLVTDLAGKLDTKLEVMGRDALGKSMAEFRETLREPTGSLDHSDHVRRMDAGTGRPDDWRGS